MNQISAEFYFLKEAFPPSVSFSFITLLSILNSILTALPRQNHACIEKLNKYMELKYANINYNYPKSINFMC